MAKNISPREWEALSAFLDKELGEREQKRLEARLETDQDLQQALEELSRTRALLRSQPKMRAPRNFTLTPEMAGIRERRPPRTYPFFRFASALATVLLVLVVIGDMFSGSPLFGRRAASEAPRVETMAASAQQQAAQEAQQEAPAAVPAGTEQPSILAAPQGLMKSQADQTEGAAEVTPEAASRAMVPEAASGTPPPGLGELTAPAEAPKAGGGTQPTPQGYQAPGATEMPLSIAQALPQSESKEAQPGAAARITEEEQQIGARRPLINESTFRILEVSLAIVALVAGVTALALRRSS